MSTREPARRVGLLPRMLTALGLMVVTAFLVLLPATAANAAGGERMTDFTAAYALQTDGSVKVKETITWQFPSGAQKHGIFRNIVVRMGYNNEQGKVPLLRHDRHVGVEPNGRPCPVHGEPERCVERDPHRKRQ